MYTYIKGIYQGTEDDKIIIENGGIGYEALLDYFAVALYLKLPLLRPEGHEYRHVAEIIKVMEHRRYAKRAHAGYEHAAVERAKVRKLLWQQAEVIKQLQKPYRKFKEQARYMAKYPGRTVKAAVFPAP